MPGHNRHGPRVQARDLTRSYTALRLYLDGHTYQQIADRMGYKSRNGPYAAVQAALRDVRAHRLHLAGQLVDEQAEPAAAKYRRHLKALDYELGTTAIAYRITEARKALDDLAAAYGLD